MKRKNLCKILLLSTALCGTKAMAQDIHFSQFYETSILRNPALTGIFSGDYKVGAMYRSQWNTISKPYQTGLVSGELRIPVSEKIKDFFSAGLLAYYDQAGTVNLQTMGVYPAINYNKYLGGENNSFLSVGLTGGYVQRSYDRSKATFNNQFQNGGYNANNATGENLPNPRITQWDAGAGISFNSSAGIHKDINYFIGVAGYHFTQAKSSLLNNEQIRLSMKWNANAGVNIPLQGPFSVEVHANYLRQGTYNELIAGGSLQWSVSASEAKVFALSAGAFWRVGDALIPTLKMEYKDFAVAVSYDFNVSSLRAASTMRGGMEISLFKTGALQLSHAENKVECPKF